MAALDSRLQEKISALLAADFADPNLSSAIADLADFASDWPTKDEEEEYCGTDLRETLQSRRLELHTQFLDRFANIECWITRMGSIVDDLATSCEEADDALTKCKTTACRLLSKAQDLRLEKHIVSRKRELVEQLLSKFRLSEGEVEILASPNVPLDRRYFETLEKLNAIIADARELTHHPQTFRECLLRDSTEDTASVAAHEVSGRLCGVAFAEDVMTEGRELLEAAMERLFLWVQSLCKDAARGDISWLLESADDLPESSTARTVKRGLRVLACRPPYFSSITDELARLRRAVLCKRFVDALSRGDDRSPPIDLHAYDLPRYIGDMIAWAHQAAAGEREFAASFLPWEVACRCKASSDGEVWPSEACVSSVISSFLDTVMSGVSARFDIRVRQALHHRNSSPDLYRSVQRLAYFGTTLEKLMLPPCPNANAHNFPPPESAVVQSCQTLREDLFTTFISRWEEQAVALRSLPQSDIYTSDLSAPPFVIDTMQTLGEIMECRRSATLVAGDVDDFTPVLDAAMDPVLNFCRQIASTLAPAQAPVFLLNCFSCIQHEIKKFDFATRRLEVLALLMEEQMVLFTRQQTESILTSVGFAQPLHLIRTHKNSDAPPPLNPVALASSLHGFFESLDSFTLLNLPQSELFSTHGLRAEARQAVAKMICDAYAELYDIVKHMKLGTLGVDEVRTLLDG